MTPAIAAAIRALIESVMRDENHSGGLLSRETLRLAALLYQAVLEVQQ
jgi:hypothetical protein